MSKRVLIFIIPKYPPLILLIQFSALSHNNPQTTILEQTKILKKKNETKKI